MVFFFNFTPGEVAAEAVLFPLVGGILVAWRIKARLRKFHRLGVDDWLVLPALLFTIACGSVAIWGVAKKRVGYTQPEIDQTPATLIVASQVYWNIEWMQPIVLGCIKSSFIFFYRRIFNVGPRKSIFNIISILSIVLMVIWMISFTLSILLICPGHVTAYWSNTDARTKFCWKTEKFLLAFSWSDVATDFVVLLLPVIPVSRLNMPTQRKVAVGAIFALGAIEILASIARAVFLVEILNHESALAALDANMTNTNGVYWMLLEIGLAMIAVNLPPLYGVAADEGLGSIVRMAQSFGSLRSRASEQAHTSDSSSVHNLNKSKSESVKHGHSIELVPGGRNWNSNIARTESLNDVDVEAGNINVTKSYAVDQQD